MSIGVTVIWPVSAFTPEAPAALTLAWSPMYACVCFVTTGTAAAAPTAAVPDAEMLPPITFIESVSSAVTPTLPPAMTVAPSLVIGPPSMKPIVVMLKTETPTLTFTAAVPPKPPPTAIEVRLSVDAALTFTFPVAWTVARLAIDASVSLVTTSMSMPAPTPAVPPIASAPAMLRIEVSSLALTAAAAFRPPTVALESMCAFVLFDMTSTMTEPATPAEFPPAPLTAISRASSDWIAETVSPVEPSASTVAPCWTEASTMPFRSRMITEAPTPALPVPMATLPDARFSLLAVSAALISILPPAWTLALPSTYALIACVPFPFSTTMRIEPATPAP